MYASKIRCFLFSVLFCLCVPSLVYADEVSTPSDASEISQELDDERQQQNFGMAVLDEISPLDDAVTLSTISDGSLVNCVRYDVTISGVQYVLLFPSAYESSLLIDDDGYLWNVSTSAISGRLFQGSFDPTADAGKLLNMSACLGNNFQENHNYGSPNSVRSYYWTKNYNNDYLQYSSEYVTVHVDKVSHLFCSSDVNTYIIIFFLGCLLICLWKRSVR